MLLRRRQLLQAIAGAPLALLAKPLLAKTTQAKPNPEFQRLRIQWIAAQAAMQLEQVISDPCARLVVFPVNFEINRADDPHAHAIEWRRNRGAWACADNRPGCVERLWNDDAYALATIQDMAHSLAELITRAAEPARLITFVGDLPLPDAGTGLFAAVSTIGYVTARAIASFNLNDGLRVLSIDTCFRVLRPSTIWRTSMSHQRFGDPR